MSDWLMIVIRSVVTIIVLFFLSKWVFKKSLQQFSFFELVIALVIGAIAMDISFNQDRKFIFGLFLIVVWSCVPVLLQLIGIKSRSFRTFVKGQSTVLIKDGKVLEDNLKKAQMTSEDLLEQLRAKNRFSIHEVEFAVLEPSGVLNVLPKRDYQPVTSRDLNLKLSPVKEGQTVIMDGEIIDEPLATAGFSRKWLKTELDKLGVPLENVFLGEVDSMGTLTVDLYDDKIQMPKPVDQPLLLASIKKCVADLETFALETDSKPAKKMYAKNAKRLKEQVFDPLEPYLKE